MREIGLVSCVDSKLDRPAQPKDLYTSPYFEKMRAYAEQCHDDWPILSAKHGVLEPNGSPIEPYDIGIDERRAWAEEVATELAERGLLPAHTKFVLHAGKKYYEELLPHLREAGIAFEILTEGLGIGKKQARYNEHLGDIQ